jgi:hypothetical protein
VYVPSVFFVFHFIYYFFFDIAEMDSTSVWSSLQFMDTVHMFFVYVTLVNIVIDLPPFQYCYLEQKVISFYDFILT